MKEAKAQKREKRIHQKIRHEPINKYVIPRRRRRIRPRIMIKWFCSHMFAVLSDYGTRLCPGEPPSAAPPPDKTVNFILE